MKQFNLEEYLKNPSRKVVTRDGQSVKIHCTNLTFNGDQLIVAEIESSGYSAMFFKDGKYFKSEETPLDLFFAPEKYEGWVNVYKGEDGLYYSGDLCSSEKNALKVAEGYNCVATIKIEWED